MSKGRIKDQDMADLDDVLGDLLAETDIVYQPIDPKPKSQGRKSPGFKGGAKSVTDENFYSSMAADLDEESDISAADPAEMAQQIGYDDMDAALFGNTKKAGKGRASPTPAKSKPSSGGGSGGLGAPEQNKPKFTPKKKTTDFDDDDDPLAGLLSDEEDSLKSKKPSARRPLSANTEDTSEHTNSQSSRRLEIERPPTRSGSNKEDEKPAPPAGGSKKKVDDIFGDEDDDVIGGMGLDSPRKVKKAVVEEESRAGKGSIMDELLGKDSSKQLEKPGSGQGSREFKLDKKYTRKEEKEEDFSFGGYMPSAAGGSRPSSRRSVRFEDEKEDDIFASRPHSTGGGGRRSGGASSFLEESIIKDDHSWLDMASGPKGKSKEQDGRPKSTGDIDKPLSILKSNNENGGASEPVDWLGLSRLGSPESPRPPPLSKTQDKPAPRTKTQNDDLSSTYVPSSNKQDKKDAAPPPAASATSEAGDDWLGLGSRKDDKDDDWLGLGKDDKNKDDGKLNFRATKQTGAPSRRQDKPAASDALPGKPESDGAGYLGLSDDTGPDTLMSSQPSSEMYRGSRQATDDLFSPPPTRDPGSSLPWERPRRRQDQGRSPERPKDPSMSSTLPVGGKSTVLADSPRSMAAQLQHLQMMKEQQDKLPAEPPAPERETRTRPSPTKSSLESLLSDPIAQPPAVRTPQPDPVSAYSLPASTVPSFSPMPAQAALQQDMAAKAAQEQELKMQMEMLQQKQQMLQMEKQQQQLKMQQEMAARQEEMRKQYMQQLLTESQQAMQPMTVPMMGSMMGFGDLSSQLQGKIHQLEMEKEHSKMMMETLKQQHQEQLRVLESSYQDRMKITQETYEQRETRLREENDLLLTQSNSKMKLLEQEKQDILSAQHTKLEAWEREKLQELDRLKELHRHTVNDIRKEHEETLVRLRKLKDQEMDTMANAKANTSSMRSLMEVVTQNTRDLGEIQLKVDQKHVDVMDEHEMTVKARDEQLRALKDRLERQQHELERERTRLTSVISKLETQLNEQSRNVDEAKWNAKQEENRLKSQQTALERERQQLLEQVKHEKQDLQRAKDELLEEQKRILGQLYNERAAVAEERAQFNISLKLQAQNQHRQAVDYKKNEAEIEGSLKVINEERSKIAVEQQELSHQHEQLAAAQARLDREKQQVQQEKSRLEQLATQLKQRSAEVEEISVQATKLKEEAQQELTVAKKCEAEQAHRLTTIQSQLTALREKEKQIAQERLSLSKERKTFQEEKGAHVCMNCRTPVRDTDPNIRPSQMTESGSGLPVPDLQQSHHQTQPQDVMLQLSPAAAKLHASLSPYLRNDPNSSLNQVSAAIQMDRSFRMMRIAQAKDKDYLEEETMFLEALKYSPYHQQS